MTSAHRAALTRALHIVQEAAERWAERRGRGLSDAQLREALAHEWGCMCGGTDPIMWGANGKTCAIWFDSIGGGKPSLQGKALLDAVREVLDLGTDPGGMAKVQAPWSGLPMMQMMEAAG